jgi:hypothetical protein
VIARPRKPHESAQVDIQRKRATQPRTVREHMALFV